MNASQRRHEKYEELAHRLLAEIDFSEHATNEELANAMSAIVILATAVIMTLPEQGQRHAVELFMKQLQYGLKHIPDPPH